MRKLKIGPMMMILAIFVLAMVTGCSKPQQEAPGKQGPGAAAGGGRGGMRGGGPGKREIPMVTAVAGIKPMTLKRVYIGEVQPAYQVDIRSNGSGWLKSLSVDIGRKVSKGQELCVVDQQDMQAQRESVKAQTQQAQAQNQQVRAQNEQALAGIAAAESTVSRAEADLQQAKSDEARTEALFQKGYVSQSAIENAKTTVKKFEAALEASKAQLMQTKAQLSQSQAQLSQAQAQISQTRAQLKSIDVRLNDMTIRAPFSGVIAEKYVDAGAYVSPSTNIVKMVDDSSVKVVINATEDDITRIAMGALSAVTLDAYPNREFHGKVIRISPIVDTVSRTGAVEILIPNRSGALKGGMMARVSLIAATNSRALAIPASAVIIDQSTGGKYVMVMNGQGLQRKNVQTGIQSGADVEIINGLSAGEKVIVSGLSPDAGINGNNGGFNGSGGGRDKSRGKGRGGK